MSEHTKVALYARYSSDLSRDASIEDQVRLCRDYANRAGWRVVETFEDRAISGASTIRPGYQALLSAVLGGGVEVVLAEALDRLSRDQEDIAALFKRLRFLGVRLVTVGEGEIGDLHIGFKGAMNALYLRDLADKTRRGLEGRVRAGRSGGGLCYGYDVVQGDERGGRAINLEEAAVVRRVLEEFARGASPKSIAHGLNKDLVPGPRGQLWRDTAIRGHRTRGTGLLNNELYVGRLVWHRLRYIKDPQTGKRVSRLNPREQWIVEEVPELRIADDELWRRVKDRQAVIEASPKVKAMKTNRVWKRRRAQYLLTGLVRCGACGGAFASMGRDYLACSNARKLDTCRQSKGVRRAIVDEAVLDLVRRRLMRPNAVEAFIAAYHEELNANRDAASTARARLGGDLDKVSGKLEGLYDAVADGLRTEGLLGKIEALEAEKARLEDDLEAPEPSPVRLHPNLAEIYREKVERLHASLQDPGVRTEALDLLRGLIDQVSLTYGENGWTIALDGDIAALIQLGTPNEHRDEAVQRDVALSSVKVVAGARNSRFLRLVESVVPRLVA